MSDKDKNKTIHSSNPEVWAEAEEVAQEETRSLSSYVVSLVKADIARRKELKAKK